MGAIAEALKTAADKMATVLGHDAAGAEHKLMHSTGSNLEANVKAHVEHDTNAAHELERAAGHEPSVPHTHGGGESVPHTSASSGPSLSTPPSVGHGGIGERGVPDEQPLSSPREKLSSSDHDYLQSSTHDREREARDGAAPEALPDVDPKPDGWPDLPPSDAANFTGRVSPTTLKAGETYYRAVGDGTYPNGSYWTTTPPHGESGLRSDLAVKNEWNGDHGIVTFTPHEDLHIGWGGTVGPQQATGGDGYLPGGGHQIWIPDGRHPQGIGENDGDWTIGRMPEGSDA